MNPPKLAREDWKIITALADELSKKLPYETEDNVVV